MIGVFCAEVFGMEQSLSATHSKKLWYYLFPRIKDCGEFLGYESLTSNECLERLGTGIWPVKPVEEEELPKLGAIETGEVSSKEDVTEIVTDKAQSYY